MKVNRFSLAKLQIVSFPYMFTISRLVAFNKPDIDFTTSLSIDKCQTLLVDEIERQSDTVAPTSDKLFDGKVAVGQFTITPKYLTKGFGIPTFYGRLVWNISGTQVVGYFAPQRWHILSWLLAGLILPLIEPAKLSFPSAVVIVFVLGCIQWLIVRFNHGSQHDVRKFLIELLKPNA